MAVVIVENPAPLTAYLNFPYGCEPMPISDLVTQGLVIIPGQAPQTAPNPLRFEP